MGLLRIAIVEHIKGAVQRKNGCIKFKLNRKTEHDENVFVYEMCRSRVVKMSTFFEYIADRLYAKRLFACISERLYLHMCVYRVKKLAYTIVWVRPNEANHTDTPTH